MADASRVGNRTNGLSSALQLHHPSSHSGQTDGIALSGVQARRMPMDHAITDSHTSVTISHSMIKVTGVTPGARKLSYFGMRVGYGRKSAIRCSPSRLTHWPRKRTGTPHGPVRPRTEL